MVACLKQNLGMRFLGVCALVAVFVTVHGHAAAMQNEPEGYGGIKWASDIRQLSGLELLAESGDLKFYERQGESLKVGNVEVDKVVYGFHKDLFYSAMLYYRSLSRFSELKEAFFKAYGDPFQPDPTAKKYFWNGENASVLLAYDEASDQGRIAYLYKPIHNQLEGNP